MSALQQIMDRRRAEAAEAHVCHSFEAQVSALVVLTSADAKWIFPWHQLAFAQFTTASRRDRLVLTFSAHTVTVGGRDLGPLCDLIARLQLASLRPAPAHYANASNAEPFVDSVIVAPHPTTPPSG